MSRIKYLLFLLCLILPYILIYRSFFTNSPLAFGDAPYFYLENLKELFQKPLVWDFRNSNFGAPQFMNLWLYLPTFLLGLLHKLTGLNNEILIRAIFYFPATILPIFTSYLFIKRFVKNNFCILLGISLYSFNNYLLLLIDGGQIGLALSYGILPISLLYLIDYLETRNLRNFVKASLVLTILTNIDLRTSILSVFSCLLIFFISAFTHRNIHFIKRIFFLIPVFSLIFLLNSFWIFPLIGFLGNKGNLFSEPISKNMADLSSGIFLFSPHFPRNEFGVTSNPPFYYLALPFIIFFGVLVKTKKIPLTLALTVLMLIFFIEGFPTNLPFGFIFRDTTKFFIPILLISGTLLAITSEVVLNGLRKHLMIAKFLFILCLLYILFLIYPTFSGELTGVLAGKPFDRDYQKIYNYIRSEPIFFRTLWFTEKPPLAFSTQGKEAISANLLYKDLPFSSMIEGNYDLFYFLHDGMLSDWFKLLGVKYVFFPENERKKSWTLKEREERGVFLKFVNGLQGFEKLNWGASFPGYKVSDPNPKIFGQEKMILVLGGTDIYQYLKNKVSDFSLSNQGFIFLEDGISNPWDLMNLSGESAVLIFKDRDEKDLAMSFLQKSFFDDKNLVFSNFGKYTPDQYLDLKSELLKYGLMSFDLGFGKGMYFSSQTGEKISFKEDIKSEGKYRLAFRSTSAPGSDGFRYKMANLDGIAKNKGRFSWDISEPIELKKGDQKIEFENLNGFNSINVLTIISEEDYQKAQFLTDQFIEKFGDGKNLSALLDLKPVQVPYKEINPTKYEINLAEKHPRWIVFSDHFSNGWRLGNSKPEPFYSMINGFLLDQGSKRTYVLDYLPQQDVDLGIKISLISLAVLAAIFLLATWRNLR